LTVAVEAGGSWLTASWPKVSRAATWTAATTSQRYLCSLYFALITITTVGYGDIVASNQVQCRTQTKKWRNHS
jgi:hypothetical protein